MFNYKILFRPICLLLSLSGIAILTLNFKNSAAPPRNISKLIIDTTKFNIATPFGWQRRIQTSNGFEILFIVAPTADGFSPNLNILTESLNGISTEEYLKTSAENMKNANMILDGSGDFQADGIQGKYSTSTFNYKGTDIATKSYVFIKDGLAYVLTGSCLISQKDTYRPIFDKTVKTFKLK
jgi:hypothetical protein